MEGYWGCRSGILLGQSRALLKRYHSLHLKVLLIGKDSLRNTWGCLLADLRHPGIQILEGVPISNGVSEYNACCAFIVCLSDGSVPFLASCIPNLQLDAFALHLNSACFEVYADSGHVVLLEALPHEGEDKIGLAHTTVSNYYQLG